MGYGKAEHDRVAAAMSLGRDKVTCAFCGHQDWPVEMYRQTVTGTDVVGSYCRNHNACQTRAAVARNKPKGNVMEFGTYTEPEQNAGDTYKPRDNYGHSAIVRVTEHKPSVVTSNSPGGGPAVIVDVYDLNTKTVARDVLIMTGALVDGFKEHVGQSPIVVKWEKRVAGNGRDYAAAVPAAQAAIDAAKTVYAAGDPFLTLEPYQPLASEEAPF